MRFLQKIWEKWKSRLVVWLGVSILIVNLFVLLVCYIFQYASVNNILLEKDEAYNIERFEQAEYNINVFCKEIDTISRKLSTDTNMQKLARGRQLPNSELYYYVNQVSEVFKTTQVYYSYIESICYYGDDGLILKQVDDDKNALLLIKDDEKIDWYYSSEINQTTSDNKRKMKLYGGYTSLDFGLELGKETSSNYYISAVRAIMLGDGVLIVNIDMNYFLDLLYASTVVMDGNYYIVDEKDRIVASKNVDEIGRERQFSEGERISEKIDKFYTNQGQRKMQVITYSLSDKGLRLVSETPVAKVTNESLYLRNILLFSCLLSVIVAFALSVWWTAKLLKPLNKLVAVMHRIGSGQLGETVEEIPGNEIGEVAKHFNQMSLEVKGLFQQKEHMEKEKRKLEMQVLRSQINPHLIYNTLNNIKWMAIINNEKNIAESISLLAAFLEPVFKNQELMCTLKEELEYVKNYIAIMNLRGTEDYTLELVVPEEYYNCQIIRFLLQPIVENSILHGLAEQETGIIRISMWEEGEDGIIQVEDDGSGIEEDRLQEILRKIEGNEIQKKGVGVVNVHRRIRAHYGEGYGLSIFNKEDGGAAVALRIRLE